MALSNTLMRRRHILLASLLLSVSLANAQDCRKLTTKPPASERRIYKHLVQRRLDTLNAQGAAQFGTYLRQGEWSVLFAKAPNVERGVFFFHELPSGPRLAEVWGGIAGGDSAASIAEWTRTISPNFPQPLAQCFATAVVSGK